MTPGVILIDRQFNVRRDGLVTDARFNFLYVVMKLTVEKKKGFRLFL